MDKSEISSLLKLLDDPDQTIYESVKNRLIMMGLPVVKFLEQSWETSYSELVQQRIEGIVHQIQLNDTYHNLAKWAKSDTKDLIYGAFLVSKYQYPDLLLSEIKYKTDSYRQDIWLELNDNLTALEKTKIFNHILFDIHGFTGNFKNLFSPQNSFINSVLETKKGNSISLAIIYAGIAQQLGLPIFGINLPKNFILAYLDQYSDNPDPQEKVLFYINPFSKGIVFGKSEITEFLNSQKIKSDKEYFSPCSNQDMIIRLVNTLSDSYKRLGYLDKVNELDYLLSALTIENL